MYSESMTLGQLLVNLHKDLNIDTTSLKKTSNLGVSTEKIKVKSAKIQLCLEVEHLDKMV